MQQVLFIFITDIHSRSPVADIIDSLLAHRILHIALPLIQQFPGLMNSHTHIHSPSP